MHTEFRIYAKSRPSAPWSFQFVCVPTDIKQARQDRRRLKRIFPAGVEIRKATTTEEVVP